MVRQSRFRPMFLFALWFCLLLIGCAAETPKPNQLPNVQLLQPEDGATFSRGMAVDIEVAASDPDGSVSHVVFYVDDEEVGAVGAPPYRYVFTVSEIREHRVAARAFDDQNADSESAQATIFVEGEEETFHLTVAASAGGGVSSNPNGISCPSACEASFSLEEDVTLSARPEAGSSFAGWGGACAGETEPSCTLNEAEAGVVEVTATFEPDEPGEVTLSLTPESASLEPGATQTFTATVTGSDNAEVTWGATGGTLEGAGNTVTYTAPAEPGSYTVTATSQADPSAVASAAVTVREATNPDAPFAIVVLPDTQNYLCSRCDDKWHPEVFRAQTEWIVENRDERNIVFVTHEGDVVEIGDGALHENPETGERDANREWLEADRAMDVLDGQVPYSVAIGDHDYNEEQRQSSGAEGFAEWFGRERYQGYPWYGGPGPRELSHYQLFSAGGYQFLHIALEWEAPDDALEWANSVIAENPGLPTIVTTHGYLNDHPDVRGRQPSPDDLDCKEGGTCRANSAETIFRELVAPNPQVFMVLNGHYHGAPGGPTETSPSTDGEYHQISNFDTPYPVYEMLANYQDYDPEQSGFLRILTFIPQGGENGLDRIQVETYSPHLDEFQTDRTSQFFFDLDFETRFDVP